MCKQKNIQVFKFIMLTIWFIFVAICVQSYSQLSIFEKADVVDKCQRYAQQKNINPARLTNIHISHVPGTRTEVYLTSIGTSRTPSSVICAFDSHGKLSWTDHVDLSKINIH